MWVGVGQILQSPQALKSRLAWRKYRIECGQSNNATCLPTFCSLTLGSCTWACCHHRTAWMRPPMLPAPLCPPGAVNTSPPTTHEDGEQWLSCASVQQHWWLHWSHPTFCGLMSSQSQGGPRPLSSAHLLTAFLQGQVTLPRLVVGESKVSARRKTWWNTHKSSSGKWPPWLFGL